MRVLSTYTLADTEGTYTRVPEVVVRLGGCPFSSEPYGFLGNHAPLRVIILDDSFRALVTGFGFEVLP